MASKVCGTWIVTDIPEEKVGSVMAAYRAQDPRTLVKQDQLDGKWKVIAVFADCPPGEPNTRERRHSGP